MTKKYMKVYRHKVKENVLKNWDRDKTAVLDFLLICMIEKVFRSVFEYFKL